MFDCKYELQEFKAVSGVYRTESLFVETISTSSKQNYTPLYTLKDFAHRGYPSMHEIYKECTDEYEAAMRICGSVHHWNKLCNLKWFLEGREGVFRGVASWREEMAARDKCLAKKTLMARVEDGDVSASRALIALAEGKNSKGRPQKKKEVHALPGHLQDHVINFSKR